MPQKWIRCGANLLRRGIPGKRERMSFRTLMIGDIVGKPGRSAVEAMIGNLIKSEELDLVIANAENSAAGSGITPAIYDSLRKAGVDVITMGDHCFRKKESIPLYETRDRLIRPGNLPEVAAGRGWCVIETRGGHHAAIINMQGRTFMKPIDCPYAAMEKALSEIGQMTPLVFLDFHAEATSDKMAMGWLLDGRVTAVAGTHTHVQTADERVLPGGTAFISDLGMTGPYDSVLGRRKDRVLRHLTSGMPTFFEVATGDVRLCGAIIAADEKTGRAVSIRRVNLAFAGEADAAYDAADGKGGGGGEEM